MRRRSSERTPRSWPSRSRWRYARGFYIFLSFKCLFVYLYVCIYVSLSVSVPLLQRRSSERTPRSWRSRSPWRYARGLCICLTQKSLFVCPFVCLFVCLSICLSLSLSYKNRAKKGHPVLGQTEVRGDTQEVCIFVFLISVCLSICMSVFMSLCLEIRKRFVFLSFL